MSGKADEKQGQRRSGEYFSVAEPEKNGAEKDSLKEVRYSLPAMLAELRMERRSSMFAMEILDQGEIDRLFTAARKPHGKSD